MFFYKKKTALFINAHYRQSWGIQADEYMGFPILA